MFIIYLVLKNKTIESEFEYINTKIVRMYINLVVNIHIKGKIDLFFMLSIKFILIKSF